MLQGFAFAAALHEVAQGRQFCFREGAVEVHVELHAAAAEDLGEEEFHIEPGVLDSGFFEPWGTRPDGIEYGLHAVGIGVAMCCGMGRISGGAQAGFRGVESELRPFAAAFPGHGEFRFPCLQQTAQGGFAFSCGAVQFPVEPCDLLQEGHLRREDTGISEDLISGAHRGWFCEIRIEVQLFPVEVGDLGFPVGQGCGDAFLGDAFEWRHFVQSGREIWRSSSR